MPTAPRYVALLDVLGFADMVMALGHEDLQRIYENHLVGNAAVASAHGRFVTFGTADGPRAVADLEQAQVRAVVFSDTIVLYSLGQGSKSFVDVCVAAGYVMLMGFYAGLPMRGGISFGQVTDFDATNGGVLGVHGLVGRPLVNAYRLEQAYLWAGCVIDDISIDQFESSPAGSDPVDLNYLITAGFLCRYRAPRRDGLNPETWVINWPRRNRGGVSVSAVERSFSAHGKDGSSEAARIKRDNTLAFLRDTQVPLYE